MSVFITVGSTGFDDLITAATSSAFLRALEAHGYTNVVFQAGASESTLTRRLSSYEGRMIIQSYQYKSSIAKDMEQADIIVSHAGSGTILQALRLHKRLIVVVNASLMDNHQAELAQAMAKGNYIVCGEVEHLTAALTRLHQKKISTFPAPDPTQFASILDKHIGFP